MICNNCCEEIHHDSDIRWAFEEAYCEDCFDRLFNYCHRCDAIINRDDSHYNSDGDPECDDCYNNNYDPDCPEDPPVYEEDRNLIITLCRNSLRWIKSPNRLINVNKSDTYLLEIRSLVGFIEKPLYLYGLYDREEYMITASEDMINQVNQFVAVELPEYVDKISICSGTRRLGISYTLRKFQRHKIVNLINKLCYDIELKMDEHFIIKMENQCAE